MQEVSDSSQPDYWTQRYASAKTPWTVHGVPENLEAFPSPDTFSEQSLDSWRRCGF